jgi:hypothetical protein
MSDYYRRLMVVLYVSQQCAQYRLLGPRAWRVSWCQDPNGLCGTVVAFAVTSFVALVIEGLLVIEARTFLQDMPQMRGGTYISTALPIHNIWSVCVKNLGRALAP